MNFFNRACAFCQAIRFAFVGVANLVMFALSVFGSYMLYRWIVDDQPVLEFGKGTASVVSVQPSDTISFFQHVRKFRDCPGRVVQIISGDCGYHVLHDEDATLIAGFDGRINHVIKIPFEVLPGRCEFRVRASYFCNPFDWAFNRQSYVSDPIEFDVKPFEVNQ